jgi:hypothetical protein
MFSELSVKISADMDGFNKSIETTGKKLAQTGKKFQDVGKNLTLGLTVPILALAGGSIKLASDFEETLNKIGVSFGENADEIVKWSESSIKSMGIAQASALEATALFGDFATGMGLTKEEATGMSMNLTQLGADLSSFKNIPVEQAMTALKGVFTGEGESLKGLGVVMLQTNLEAFALSQGIQKNVADMTEAEKINLRYAFVMDATKNAQGDFARTSEGSANQMKIFKETLIELGTQFGQILLPLFTQVIKKVNSVAQYFMGLNDTTKLIILVVGGLIAVIPPLLVLMGTMMIVTAPLIPMFAALGVAVNSVTWPIALAILAVVALIAVGVVLYKNWDTISIKLKQIFTAMSYAIGNAMSVMKISVLNTIKSVLDGVQNLANFLPWLGNKVKGLSEDIDKMINEEEVKKQNRILQYELTQSGLVADLNVIKNEKLSASQDKLNKDTNELTDSTSKLSDAKMKDEQATEATALATEKLAESQKLAVEAAKEAREENLENLNALGEATIDALKSQYDQQERLQLDSLKNQTDNIRSETDDRIKEYEREYNSKLKLIDNQVTEETKALDILIDNLNNQTKAENKALKEQEFASKLFALQQKLIEIESAKDKEEIQYLSAEELKKFEEKNNKEKQDVQNKINEMMTDRDREQTLEARQIQIEAFRVEIENIREQASLKRDEASKEFEDKKINAELDQTLQLENLKKQEENLKNHFTILRTQENIEAKARRLMVDKDNQQLIDLLKTYNPKWQDSGTSFGESMLDGLKSKKKSIQDEVKSILGLVDQANAPITTPITAPILTTIPKPVETPVNPILKIPNLFDIFTSDKFKPSNQLKNTSMIKSPTLNMATFNPNSQAVMPSNRMNDFQSYPNIYLDGRELTKAIAPRMVDMMRARGVTT